MEYSKLIKIILILDFFIIAFLAVISFTFLSEQYQKTKQIDPEILAQYNIGLDLDKFYQVIDDVRQQK